MPSLCLVRPAPVAMGISVVHSSESSPGSGFPNRGSSIGFNPGKLELYHQCPNLVSPVPANVF